jgi:hypothetical protein
VTITLQVTITLESEVTITLESETDPYLYLRIWTPTCT